MAQSTVETPAADTGAGNSVLRRELGRFDTIFFIISALVVVDTVGAVAVGGVAVVAMSVFGRFVAPLSTPGLYGFGTLFVLIATLGAVVPLRSGKWVPTSGAIGLLAVFTVTVVVYATQPGGQGVGLGSFTPTAATFIAVVPVLIFSFIGVERPATTAEENP